MRVMVDTNILISALLFPSKNMDALIYKITTKYTLVLSSHIIKELTDVTKRKFKNKVAVVDTLLSQLPYEFVYTPSQLPLGAFEIRDIKDYPILYSAVAEGVDIFITGDKDFDDIDIEKPEILTPSAFLEYY